MCDQYTCTDCTVHTILVYVYRYVCMYVRIDFEHFSPTTLQTVSIYTTGKSYISIPNMDNNAGHFPTIPTK